MTEKTKYALAVLRELSCSGDCILDPGSTTKHLGTCKCLNTSFSSPRLSRQRDAVTYLIRTLEEQ